MTNKYIDSLSKKASTMIGPGPEKNSTAKDLVHTGVIGSAGFGTSYLASRMVNGAEHSGNRKAALIGGALGLAGDYAAVKLNKHIDKGIDKLASTSNRYLEKIAGFGMSTYVGGDKPGPRAVLDVANDGNVHSVHNAGSETFKAADAAKHINPSKAIKHRGPLPKVLAGAGAAVLGTIAAKQLYNRHVSKKNESKIEKKASVQHLHGYTKYGKGPVTDKKVAATNTGFSQVASKFAGPLALPGKIALHISTGRSFGGAIREETRGMATSVAKGVGYGVAGAAAGAGIGAAVGKLAGNRRVAKTGANLVGKVFDMAKNRAGQQGMHIPSGKAFLDRMAGEHPEMVKKVLSDKHLGIKGGAAIGAAGGLVAGSTVGSVKGEYDGRLASIRNQIRDGSLKNVTSTEKREEIRNVTNHRITD